MPGLILTATDDFGNDYPAAYWTVAESHLLHADQRGTLIVAPFRDAQAFAQRKRPIPGLARSYGFAPEASPAVLDENGDEVRPETPAFSHFFSEAVLSSGNNPFAAIYLWLMSLPEFEGAQFSME